jgi:hypothetical protein
MSEEFDSLSEQLRREIRERMDIFLNDASDLARKYCGADAVKENPGLAFPIAAALSQHFAAHIVANALRENTEQTRRLVDETRENTQSMRMIAAMRQGQAR